MPNPETWGVGKDGGISGSFGSLGCKDVVFFVILCVFLILNGCFFVLIIKGLQRVVGGLLKDNIISCFAFLKRSLGLISLTLFGLLKPRTAGQSVDWFCIPICTM